MLRAVALSFAFAAVNLPAAAFACGGEKTAANSSAEDADSDAHANPTACAKKADLVGANCSYSTGMMAQRVIAEGAPYTFAGRLAAAPNELDSHVAAPFVVGPEKIAVVANEVLEQITAADLQAQRLNLQGRVLEVDGVKYFVLTGFEKLVS